MNRVIHDWATEVQLSKDEAEDICKLGQGEECCAFLTMSHLGFECIRMSYNMNSDIFSGLKDGTMNAKGEGCWKGCPWEEYKIKGD